ncbi:hypothetical protein DFH28DRAFT_1027417 [Melampsora americana]|nr:hypothetical protein DFH28DRAFT_1027417 [Melampsora americana]
MQHGNSTISKLPLLICLISQIWSLQSRFTPYSIIESFTEENIWLEPGVNQGAFLPYEIPKLHTEADHFQPYNLDQIEDGTYWNTDLPPQHGPSSNKLINPLAEEHLGVCGTTLLMDRSTISSYYDFHDPVKGCLHTHQRIHQRHHQDGSNLLHDSCYVKKSQSGMMTVQHEASVSGTEGSQKRSSEHLDNNEASLPSNDMVHETNFNYWDNLLNLYLNDIFARIPISSTENNLFGRASPRIISYTQDFLQDIQPYGHTRLPAASDGNTDTPGRDSRTYMDWAHVVGNVGAFHTPSNVLDKGSSVIHQTQSSNPRKKISIEEEVNNKLKDGSTILVDNSTHIGSLGDKTHPRKKLRMKKNLEKFQGVIEEYISGPVLPTSVTKNIAKFTGTKKHQHFSSITDNSRQISKDVFITSMREGNQVKEDKKQPGQSTLIMLKDIGDFYAANSLVFAHKVPIWFKLLRDDMMEISGQEESLRKAIQRAIECAHWWVTMSLFGLVSTNSNPEVDGSSLEEMLDCAWQLIQSIFDQWRYMRVKNMEPQMSCEVGDHWIEPQFLFGYLSKLQKFSTMSLKILKSIAARYNKEPNTSKIHMNNIRSLQDKLKMLYNKDMMAIKGGFYSRGSIGNLEFEEQRFHSGHRNCPWSLKSSNRARIVECRSISRAAKFLSPVGIDLCQKVHTFFVDLIIELIRNYKISNKIYPYPLLQIHLPDTVFENLKDQHESNMKTIVKAVSIAEYRVTVGFIGMLRSLYEKCSTEVQLNTIIGSGWDFLKTEFSKWKLLSFEEGTHSSFFTHSKRLSQEEKSYLDPKRTFQGLCKQTQDLSDTPLSLMYLKMLLRSWFDGASDPHVREALGDSIILKIRSCISCLELLKNP